MWARSSRVGLALAHWLALPLFLAELIMYHHKANGGSGGIMDQDAFLTQLESKLRGPFSSLELAKAVSQAALTEHNHAGHHSSYLDQVAAVLSRAEKVTQLRLLVGLLGLDENTSKVGDNAEDDDDDQQQQASSIQTILEAAQEAPLYDEWVRVIAGIVHNTLFGHDDNNHNNSEADEILDKTCREILDRVRTVERQTATIDEDTEYRLGQSDAEPIALAPYRYALIDPELLYQIIPEAESHQHFQIVVEPEAEILLMDAKLELERKKEELEYQQTGAAGAAATLPKQPANQQPTAPDFPGFRSKTTTTAAASNNNKPASKIPPKKASLFLPSKRPLPSAGGSAADAAKRLALGIKPSLQKVQGPGLQMRRPGGAARALLGKSRRIRGVATTTTQPSTTTATKGGAHHQARSKMRMIDVAEVQGLEQSKKEQEQQQQQAANTTGKLGRKAQLLAGKKRSKPDTSETTPSLESKVARPKLTATTATAARGVEDRKVAAATDPAPPPTNALAVAALTAYQAQQESNGKPPGAGQLSNHHHHQHHQSKQQDWRELLREKSNKLSQDDRLRIAQFFTDHFNPTPEQLSYKVKLHEERTVDPKTGEQIKETFYLELDYQTFTSKQSKKIKRYTN